MVSLSELLEHLRDTLTEWRSLSYSDLVFHHRDTAILILFISVSILGLLLLARYTFWRRVGRDKLPLPAILPTIRTSPISFVRNGALLLFIAGLPFFMLALAAPYSSLAQQRVSYPGRRIALMIDASSSMMRAFPAERLRNPDPRNKAVFFTNVAAAQFFIRQRMKGSYKDLIALIEFGNDAYVITPFTNDYENVLLSTSLIGDWTEFADFPDRGTTIGVAIEQGINLFRTFNYLNAAGNLMVIFSDGQDTQVTLQGRTVTQVLRQALEANIPVYFIRTSQNRQLGDIIPDAIWKPAVEATGGRFYAAAKEEDILRAIHDIDARSAGEIQLKQYTSQKSEFSPFAVLAIALWMIGLSLKLTVPYLNSFR